MVNCSVLNCKSNNDKRLKRNKDESVRKELKYFRFPRDEKYAKLWIEKCGRVDKMNVKTSYVCSKHFTSEHYARNLQHELLNYCPKNSRKLKWDAVPTEYLPYTIPDIYISKQTAEPNHIQPKKNSKKFVLEIVNSAAKIEFVVESEPTLSSEEADCLPYEESEPDPNCIVPQHTSISVDAESHLTSIESETSSCPTTTECIEQFVEPESISIFIKSESVPNSFASVTDSDECVPNISYVDSATEDLKYENCYTNVEISQYAEKTTNTDISCSLTTESENLDLKNTIESLKKEIKELKDECVLLKHENDCIGTIFTAGQRLKLQKLGKRIKWEADDISQAIELYTCGPKAYRFLLEKNYPLPSVSTLKAWMSKKATSTFDKEDLLVDEMFDVDEFFEESGTESISANTMTFTVLQTLTDQNTSSDPETV